MFATVENANGAIWLYTVNEYTGDMDVKGHSVGGGYILDYYCIIKISPADTTHKYLDLKVSADFYYGMSAGWFSGASWVLRYAVLDMSQVPIHCDGWTKWFKSVSVGWGGVLDYQSYHAPDTYYELYSDYDRWLYYYTFSSSQWYYVGVWMRLSLTNYADIYKTSYASGLADWDINYISWMFFE